MTNGSSAFLVDTNVLVYAYDPSDEDKRERAIEVLQSLGDSPTGPVKQSDPGRVLRHGDAKNPYTHD
jgi:hypothetical protein